MAQRTLVMEESRAKSIYKTATAEVKGWLEENFGKSFFSDKITDRIKTWKDVVDEYRNVYGLTVSMPCEGRNKQERSINAFYMIQIISFVLNEGWKPDFTNGKEQKWYLWFEKIASGWAVDVGCVCAGSFVGAGFHFKTRELALHAGNNFLPIFVDYLPE